jgi:ribosomal-protein-alanine N-acetyltransferase
MARQPNHARLRITNATPVAIEERSFPTPWSRKALAEELRRPWSIFRILRGPRDEVLAYLNYWVVFDELHVLNIATHPDHRRRGYARLLLEEMVRQARRNAVREIHLEVRPSNRPAQLLYEALGFRPGYYADTEEDALLYGLSLPPDRR